VQIASSIRLSAALEAIRSTYENEDEIMTDMTKDQLPEDETNKLAFLPVLAFGVGLGVVVAYFIVFGLS
jgi:hypothetical protein